MKIDLKNKVHRDIFIYSVSLILAIIAFLLLTRVNDILGFIGKVVSLLAPFLLGFGLAFLLDGPILWMQNRLTKTSMSPGTARKLAAVCVFILFLLFIVFGLWVVIPSLLDSITVFLSNFSSYAARFEETLEIIGERYNLDLSSLINSLKNLDITSTITNVLQSSVATMMSYSVNVIHWASNLVIALAAAIYMILDKKRLLQTMKVVTYSIFGRKTGNFIQLYSMDAKNIFQQYIVGNIIDSLIVGLIAWFGCFLFGFPYSPMIGFIIGVTNIIPVFGPFLGAIPVIALLFIIKPMDALIFAVFILVVQQIDGNVLKPLILGDKLGISGFWILFSVTIGGALFGVVGMFLGVPVFALVYEGFKDLSALQLKERRLQIPNSSSIIDEETESIS